MHGSSKAERERSFHNRVFEERGRERLAGAYSIHGVSRDHVRRLLTERDLAGREVLEFGCGVESMAFWLAGHGAEVTGIDIADVAIEMAQARAAAEGVGDRTRFVRMDAERMTFPAASFDVICGSAILHHLDLELAYAEVARVMRPDGFAVFLEPLGHNPFINAFRRRTPQMRTPDEHPLLMEDLVMARRWFDRVEIEHFHLTSLAAVPLRATSAFRTVVGGLDRLDAFLFDAFPRLAKHSWFSVIRLADPRA